MEILVENEDKKIVCTDMIKINEILNSISGRNINFNITFLSFIPRLFGGKEDFG